MRADAEGQTALRLRQGAQRAEKLDRAVPGRFVTGMERQEAQREAKVCSVLASFDGGWDDAERVQVCFHPDGVDAEFTAVWLEISWAAKFARVGHSDLLGSLMALGMDRSLFGDLMVEDGTAYLLAMPEAAKSLQDEWHEAGHTAIRVRLLDGGVLEIAVYDWGRGIADVEKAREPLFTTGGEERSGMGFTIMESFMDKLKVKSTPGKGTTVTMLRTIRQRRGFR